MLITFFFLVWDAGIIVLWFKDIGCTVCSCGEFLLLELLFKKTQEYLLWVDVVDSTLLEFFFLEKKGYIFHMYCGFVWWIPHYWSYYYFKKGQEYVLRVNLVDSTLLELLLKKRHRNKYCGFM